MERDQGETRTVIPETPAKPLPIAPESQDVSRDRTEVRAADRPGSPRVGGIFRRRNGSSARNLSEGGRNLRRVLAGGVLVWVLILLAALLIHSGRWDVSLGLLTLGGSILLAGAAVLLDHLSVLLDEWAGDQRKARRFDAIFGHAGVGLAVMRDDAFEEVNPAFLNMLGYDISTNAVSLKYKDVIHPNELGQSGSYREELRSGVRDQFQWMRNYLRKDGTSLKGWTTMVLVPGANYQWNRTDQRILKELAPSEARRFGSAQGQGQSPSPSPNLEPPPRRTWQFLRPRSLEQTELVLIVEDFTERYRAVDELGRSRSALQSLVDHAPDVIVRFDPDFRYVLANPAALEMLGRPLDQVLKKTHEDLGIERSLISRLESEVNRVFRDWETTTTEFTFPTPSGLRIFQAALVPEFPPNRSAPNPAERAANANANANAVERKPPENVLMLARDVTELVRAQVQLQQSETFLTGIMNTSPNGILALRALRRAEPPLATADANVKNFANTDGDGADGDGAGDATATATAPNESRNARFGEILDFEIVLANQAAARIFQRKGRDLLNGKICEQFPVYRSQGLSAVFSAVVETGTQRTFEHYFGEDHPVPWQLISAVKLDDGLAVTITNITQRKRDEQQLQESERFIQSIADTTPDALYLFQYPEFEQLYANREAARMLGYPADEFGARAAQIVTRLVEADPRHAEHRDRLGVLPDGEVVERELRVQRQNGQWSWFNCRERVFHRNNDLSPRIILGAAQDITERKHALEALASSEARYRTIVEEQSELVCRYLPDGTITYINRAYSTLLGLPVHDLVGTSFLPPMLFTSEMSPETHEAHPVIASPVIASPDLANRDDEGKPVSRVRKIAQSLEPLRTVEPFEFPLILRDGSIRWIQWTNRALTDELGRIEEYQAVGRDCTSRRESENALRTAREEFRLVVDAMNAAFWVSGADPKFPRRMNSAFEQILGVSRRQILDFPEGWLSLVIPEDRPIVQRVLNRLVATNIDESELFNDSFVPPRDASEAHSADANANRFVSADTVDAGVPSDFSAPSVPGLFAGELPIPSYGSETGGPVPEAERQNVSARLIYRILTPRQEVRWLSTWCVFSCNRMATDPMIRVVGVTLDWSEDAKKIEELGRSVLSLKAQLAHGVAVAHRHEAAWRELQRWSLGEWGLAVIDDLPKPLREIGQTIRLLTAEEHASAGHAERATSLGGDSEFPEARGKSPYLALADRLEELSRQLEQLQSGARLRGERFRAFSPAALVREVADLLTPEAAAAGVSLTTDCPDDLPWVRADPDALRQVMRHLAVVALSAARDVAAPVLPETSNGTSRSLDVGAGLAGPERVTLWIHSRGFPLAAAEAFPGSPTPPGGADDDRTASFALSTDLSRTLSKSLGVDVSLETLEMGDARVIFQLPQDRGDGDWDYALESWDVSPDVREGAPSREGEIPSSEGVTTVPDGLTPAPVAETGSFPETA